MIRRHDRQHYTSSACWAISRYRSSTDYSFSAESTPRQWLKFVPISCQSYPHAAGLSVKCCAPPDSVIERESSAGAVRQSYIRSDRTCASRGCNTSKPSSGACSGAASLIVKFSRCSRMLPLIHVSSNSLVRVSAWTLPSPDRACELLTPSNLLPQELTPLCALDSRGHS